MTMNFQTLLIDLIAVFILVRWVYMPHHKNSENVFTFYIFNLVIFLITQHMNTVQMSMGAAFGLFAVFSMLRYRTENISIKEMTYIFISIAIGLITAVGKSKWYELIGTNSLIIGMIYLLESNLIIRQETSQNIIYDNIELIEPAKREELVADLENRIGVKINHIVIGDIDFLKDAVNIKVFY